MSNLAILREEILSCRACTLRQEALSPVPFEGNPKSKFVIVGRNPGREENELGRPFVGRGGRFLDDLLISVNIDRSKIWITNTAKCYSTNDRQPDVNEYTTCVKTHLVAELLALRPQLIVVLGNDAFHHVTGCWDSVTKNRQRFFSLPSIGAEVVGTWHPGSALRSPRAAQEIDEDFRWLVQTSQFKSAMEAVDE